MMCRFALTLTLLTLLAGCTVGPNYRKPDPKVPSQWVEAPSVQETIKPVDVSCWWTLFKDEQLNTLITRAIASNKELRLAGARIREARALRGVVAADAFPNIDVSGSYARSKRSENSTSGPGSTLGIRVPSSGEDLFQAGFDAGWEIDIFGGVRRSVEAAEADIASSEEDRRDVLVTLLGEVGRNYLQVRGDQLRIAIARENIELQRQTLELVRARFEAGLSSSLDVAQAEAQLSVTEATVPALEASMRRSIYQLGILLGMEPGALVEELSVDAPLPATLVDIPVGLPSELLRRRPDIRRAERNLAAATARIGVAMADLFPRFSLTGSLGRQSVEFADLMRSGSTFWSIGPTISWPIFDAGRIRANIQVQRARQEQIFIQYEQAVLVALQDVENALVSYEKEQATRAALGRAVEANLRSVDIANELYTRGLVDFLNVLESQRSLYQSQDQLAQSDQLVLSDLVALFKALGGGWERALPESKAGLCGPPVTMANHSGTDESKGEDDEHSGDSQ